MYEQDPAGQLSTPELACLRYLAEHPDAELSQFDRLTVDRLVSRGLVDKIPLLAFPVMPSYYRYRLTRQGYDVLAAAARGGS